MYGTSCRLHRPYVKIKNLNKTGIEQIIIYSIANLPAMWGLHPLLSRITTSLEKSFLTSAEITLGLLLITTQHTPVPSFYVRGAQKTTSRDEKNSWSFPSSWQPPPHHSSRGSAVYRLSLRPRAPVYCSSLQQWRTYIPAFSWKRGPKTSVIDPNGTLFCIPEV